jgi:hypothetical protein
VLFSLPKWGCGVILATCWKQPKKTANIIIIHDIRVVILDDDLSICALTMHA